MIVQKLRKKGKDKFDVAFTYFSLLSSLGNMSLTERELQLLAFTCVRGNMTLGNVKEEFCKRFNTTFPTISNIVYKLKKMGLLIKDEGRIKVNRQFALDFKNGVTLNIVLENDSEQPA